MRGSFADMFIIELIVQRFTSIRKEIDASFALKSSNSEIILVEKSVLSLALLRG